MSVPYALVLTMLIVAMGVLGVPLIKRAIHFSRAVPVPATITSTPPSFVLKQVVTKRGRVREMWTPVIEFGFQDAGVTSRATTFTLGEPFMTRPWANRVAASYAPGQAVTAWRLDDAQKSVILAKATSSDPVVLLMLLGMGVGVFGTILMCIVLPGASSTDPPAVACIAPAMVSGVLILATWLLYGAIHTVAIDAGSFGVMLFVSGVPVLLACMGVVQFFRHRQPHTRAGVTALR